jgi:DNA polymerase III psi subunit
MKKFQEPAMIKEIISGGQTGADQAALDVAIKFAIPHGGWIPKGRRTENGPLPHQYKLKEMPTISYYKRTEQNVLDSDATLLISHGKLTGGSYYTRRMAKHYHRPWLHIDLNKINGFEAAKRINSWILKNDIEKLNVAGPRVSEDPKIYQAAFDLIQTTFHLNLMETSTPNTSRPSPSVDDLMGNAYLPKTIDEAVARLIKDFSLKDKAYVAKMNEEDLHPLQHTIGRYIREEFGLWTGNLPLMQSCLSASKNNDLSEADASALIIRALWKKLRQSYRLRVVK